MDQLAHRIKQLTNEYKEYIETRLDLMVLNVGEQVTQWLGESIQKLIGYSVLGVGFLFAMIALAFYLAELLNSTALGFLVVSIPLLIAGAALASARPKGISRSIQNQFMDGIIRSIEKDEKNNDLPEIVGPKQLQEKQ